MAAAETQTIQRKTHEQFLVTAFSSPDDSPASSQPFRSAVWDTSVPLALGHPFRWALERTETGVRCRRLDAKDGLVVPDSCAEISFEELPSHLIPLGASFWLKIRPITGMPTEP